jgi:hypothetical protein
VQGLAPQQAAHHAEVQSDNVKVLSCFLQGEQLQPLPGDGCPQQQQQQQHQCDNLQGRAPGARKRHKPWHGDFPAAATTAAAADLVDGKVSLSSALQVVEAAALGAANATKVAAAAVPSAYAAAAGAAGRIAVNHSGPLDPSAPAPLAAAPADPYGGGGGGSAAVAVAGEVPGPQADEHWDTVGCVVVDCEGAVVAGVSSGGLAMKWEGRVGEAALHGAGCWASDGYWLRQTVQPTAADAAAPGGGSGGSDEAAFTADSGRIVAAARQYGSTAPGKGGGLNPVVC